MGTVAVGGESGPGWTGPSVTSMDGFGGAIRGCEFRRWAGSLEELGFAGRWGRAFVRCRLLARAVHCGQDWGFQEERRAWRDKGGGWVMPLLVG